MKKKSQRSIWGFPLNPAQRDEIQAQLVHTNHRTFCLMAVVILIFQAVMMAITLFKPGGPFTSFRRTMYWWMYVLLFVCTLIFLLVIRHIYRVKPLQSALYLRLEACYTALFCYWSCGITLLDQMGGTSLGVYSYVCISLAALAILKPWQGLAIFASSFLVLNLCLPLFEQGQRNIFNNLINTLFITVLSVLLSSLFYRNKVYSLHDKKVIEKQYQAIEEMNIKLEHLTITDELTGMHNRRYLERVSGQPFFAAGKWVTGMMLDIDFFKQYNDRYGHIAGDTCLREMARIITSFTAGKEACAVRYGGEEFFLCIAVHSEEQALNLATTLREEVAGSAPRQDDTKEGRVTVSIGLHTMRIGDDADQALREMIRCADEALYQAKKSGRNCVCAYRKDESDRLAAAKG